MPATNKVDNRRILADNLNRYMLYYGYTRKGLSEELSVPYTTVCDWCNGIRFPRIDKIEKLANLFGVNKSALIEKQVIVSRNTQQGTNQQQVIDVLNDGKWWDYLPDNIPEQYKDELVAAIDAATAILRITSPGKPSMCEGCKNIAFRFPYPSMYPCDFCIRVHRKDYFASE